MDHNVTNEVKKKRRKNTFVKEENEFCFGHVEFEMLVAHSRGDT